MGQLSEAGSGYTITILVRSQSWKEGRCWLCRKDPSCLKTQVTAPRHQQQNHDYEAPLITQRIFYFGMCLCSHHDKPRWKQRSLLPKAWWNCMQRSSSGFQRQNRLKSYSMGWHYWSTWHRPWDLKWQTSTFTMLTAQPLNHKYILPAKWCLQSHLDAPKMEALPSNSFYHLQKAWSALLSYHQSNERCWLLRRQPFPQIKGEPPGAKKKKAQGQETSQNTGCSENQ